MGQQLIIPGFKQPVPNITLEHVQKCIPTISYEVPSNKEIRLAIDLARQLNPLFEFHVEENIDLIRRVLQYDVSKDTVLNVKPFKKILFKEIIISVKHIGDGKYKVKTKKVRRWNNT